MAAVTPACCFSSSLHCHRRPTKSLLFSDSRKPFFASKPITLSRLSVSRARSRAPTHKLKVISDLINGCSEADPESELDDSNKEVTIDLKLPRRRLLVQFTCNLCGERSQRLINPLAYERGLVYVQCAGCLKHHKLVDNLGLVVEYNLRDEINPDAKEDEADR